MPRILFWNVERLGAGTDPRIKEMVAWVVNHAMENFQVTDAYLCEVTSDFSLVLNPADSSSIQLGKQGERQRRSRRRTKFQLGYAHVHTMDVPAEPANIILQSHSKIFGIKPGDFAHAMDPIRHLVRHGKDTYLLHANSGKGGGAPFQIIRAWVQVYYDAFGAPPVIFGDLNCEPGVLERTRVEYLQFLTDSFKAGANIEKPNSAVAQWSIAAAIDALEDMAIVCGGPTFKVESSYTYGKKDALVKTYDYAVTTKENELYVEEFDYRDLGDYRSEFTTKVAGGITVGPTGCPSDHLPLVLSWGEV